MLTKRKALDGGATAMNDEQACEVHHHITLSDLARGHGLKCHPHDAIGKSSVNQRSKGLTKTSTSRPGGEALISTSASFEDTKGMRGDRSFALHPLRETTTAWDILYKNCYDIAECVGDAILKCLPSYYDPLPSNPALVIRGHDAHVHAEWPLHACEDGLEGPHKMSERQVVHAKQRATPIDRPWPTRPSTDEMPEAMAAREFSERFPSRRTQPASPSRRQSGLDTCAEGNRLTHPRFGVEEIEDAFPSGQIRPRSLPVPDIEARNGDVDDELDRVAAILLEAKAELHEITSALAAAEIQYDRFFQEGYRRSAQDMLTFADQAEGAFGARASSPCSALRSVVDKLAEIPGELVNHFAADLMEVRVQLTRADATGKRLKRAIVQARERGRSKAEEEAAMQAHLMDYQGEFDDLAYAPGEADEDTPRSYCTGVQLPFPEVAECLSP